MADSVSSTLSSLSAAYTVATTEDIFVEEGTDATQLADDFDAFLLLLTTQMSNQDPLQPMDSSEFTNQLVMFAQAEQAVKQSGYLSSMVDSTGLSQSMSAAGYIGLDVIVPGNDFKPDVAEFNDDGSVAEYQDEILTYYFPQEASEATLTIKDSKGETVFQAELDGDAGEYNVSWDGKDQDGNPVEQGLYSFSIDALDMGGDIMDGVTYATRGVVTNVRYDGQETSLTLDGDRVVALDEVTGVGLSGQI